MKHSFSGIIISMESSSEYYPRATPAYSHSSLPYMCYFCLLSGCKVLWVSFLEYLRLFWPPVHVGFGPEGAGEGDLGARAPGSPCSCLRILELILAPQGAGCCHHFQSATVPIWFVKFRE